MARELTQNEQVRYPWATRINDYTPVGTVRRWSLILAWSSLAAACLVWLLVYMTMSRGAPGQSVHLGTAWRVLVIAFAVVSFAGGVAGLVTLVQAVMKNARTAMVWSVATAIPAALWLSYLIK